MRRLLLASALVGLAVVASTGGVPQSVAQAARDPKEIQAVVEQLRKIPIGSDIPVQLVDGQKLEAVLLDVTSSGTRIAAAILGGALAYMAFRVLVDALKPDPRLALGLSANQWAALLTLGYYVFVFRQQPAQSA